MEAVFDNINEQYENVLESRRVLLSYCEAISPTDFVNENSLFGRGGSIRNLLVHIANVYEFWIADKALKRNITFSDYNANENIRDIAALFQKVDIFMKEFIEMFRSDPGKLIEYTINGSSDSASLLKIFTHVITHEFHHKGQVLSLSRHLGYIPVDTDVIR